MRVFKENFKGKLNGIILFLVEALLGILLLVNPIGFTRGIIVTAGVLLTIAGIVHIIAYFRSTPQEGFIGKMLSKGLLEIIGGLFCALNSQWFIATFPILAILYGIGTLVSGIVKVEMTVDLIRLKGKRWELSAVGAALTILCAVIILLNPFGTTIILWRFVAISLIIEAVVDLVSAFLPSREKDANETVSE